MLTVRKATISGHSLVHMSCFQDKDGSVHMSLIGAFVFRLDILAGGLSSNSYLQSHVAQYYGHTYEFYNKSICNISFDAANGI